MRGSILAVICLLIGVGLGVDGALQWSPQANKPAEIRTVTVSSPSPVVQTVQLPGTTTTLTRTPQVCRDAIDAADIMRKDYLRVALWTTRGNVSEALYWAGRSKPDDATYVSLGQRCYSS